MDTRLMKLTEKTVSSNEQLQKFVSEATGLTTPLFPDTFQNAEPGFKYGAAIVSVDAKVSAENKWNNRDIYKNESGGFCLHLSKLNEIAQQAGLQVTDSRILERKTDEQGRVTYINHQVKWRIKSVDGSVKEGVATGKYDYYNDVATKSEGMVKSRRKHAEALAESNALTRAYNKAIAKLPQSFTLDELKKPFLVPYVIEDKNELLKELPQDVQLDIKKQVAMKRLGLVNEIYPANEQRQIETATVIEEDTEPEQKPDETKKLQFSPEEENHIKAETYRDANQKERTERILELIKLKGYTDPSGGALTAERIEKNSVDNQVKFIEKLMNMPDQQEVLPL
jgi:hypothetical protein